MFATLCGGLLLVYACSSFSGVVDTPDAGGIETSTADAPDDAPTADTGPMLDAVAPDASLDGALEAEAGLDASCTPGSGSTSASASSTGGFTTCSEEYECPVAPTSVTIACDCYPDGGQRCTCRSKTFASTCMSNVCKIKPSDRSHCSLGL